MIDETPSIDRIASSLEAIAYAGRHISSIDDRENGAVCLWCGADGLLTTVSRDDHRVGDLCGQRVRAFMSAAHLGNWHLDVDLSDPS